MSPIAVACVAVCAGGAAAHGTFEVEIVDWLSYDGLGDSDNMVAIVALDLPGVRISNVAWDFLALPLDPSWSSEINFRFSDTAQTSVFDWHGGNFGGLDNSDPLQFHGNVDTSFFLGEDGRLRIEVWESFDDSADAADAFLESGVLRFTFVPSPGGVIALGLGGVGMLGRRR